MSDPRNVAHDKTVQQEKKNHHEEIAPGAIETPQPGKKPALEKANDEGETYQQHIQQDEDEQSAE